VSLPCRKVFQVFHLRAGGNVLNFRSLTQLQCAYISRHRPAIHRGQLRRVIRHGAVAVRHHVEVVADRLCEPDLVVKIGGRFVTSLDDSSEAVADPRMAGRAIDIEALLAALEHIESHRKRHQVLLFAIAVCALHHAGVEVAVLAQLAAGHSVHHLRARAAMVGKHLRPALRNQLGLVLHVLAAAGKEHHRRKTGGCNAAARKPPRCAVS
jgi:hypothetical protein